MKPSFSRRSGNTLIVSLSFIVILSALVGAAMRYTQHHARLTQRTRISNAAMEIGDGCLEMLFTHWRNTYRATGGLVLPTNYFYTTSYAPGALPATPPPLIPKPANSMFPDVPQNFTISNYRIQAVDPMLHLKKDYPAYYSNPADPEQSTVRDTDNAPPISGKTTFFKDEEPRCFPGAFGPGSLQFSFYYLASADVTYPALGGTNITAKVRRVFEKKFNTPWTWALMFNDDLEIHPSTNLTIDGPVHTNGSLYTGSDKLTLTDKTTYNGTWKIGYAPGDSVHPSTPTSPNYPSNLPPGQDNSYLPFGWNAQQMFNLGDGNTNNEGYREIIERPDSAFTDPVASQRYYNQADIKVTIDASNTITIRNGAGTVVTSSSSGADKNLAIAVNGALQTNKTFQDNREAASVRVANLDIKKVYDAVAAGQITDSTGYGIVIHISDTSATSTTRRGIRLVNGTKLPPTGLTVVSDNPVYVQGDYNTGGIPPSSAVALPDPTKPTVSGYTRVPAAIIADAVTVLSNNWSDSNSSNNLALRIAANTTVNAALVAGTVPTGSSGSDYSGGAESFVRFLEDWNLKNFTYYGSMVQIFASQQAVGAWGSANVYNPPKQYFYYDTNFADKSPPGSLVFASYLQQQRWFLVY